jgi:hypothetical protein
MQCHYIRNLSNKDYIFHGFLSAQQQKLNFLIYIVLLNNKDCDIFIIRIAIKFHKCYVIMRYLSNLCSVIK